MSETKSDSIQSQVFDEENNLMSKSSDDGNGYSYSHDNDGDDNIEHENLDSNDFNDPIFNEEVVTYPDTKESIIITQELTIEQLRYALQQKDIEVQKLSEQLSLLQSNRSNDMSSVNQMTPNKTNGTPMNINMNVNSSQRRRYSETRDGNTSMMLSITAHWQQRINGNEWTDETMWRQRTEKWMTKCGFIKLTARRNRERSPSIPFYPQNVDVLHQNNNNNSNINSLNKKLTEMTNDDRIHDFDPMNPNSKENKDHNSNKEENEITEDQHQHSIESIKFSLENAMNNDSIKKKDSVISILESEVPITSSLDHSTNCTNKKPTIVSKDISADTIGSDRIPLSKKREMIHNNTSSLVSNGNSLEEQEVLLSPDQKQARLLEDISIDLNEVISKWQEEAMESIISQNSQSIINPNDTNTQSSSRKNSNIDDLNHNGSEEDEEEEDDDPTVLIKLHGEPGFRELSAQDMYLIVLQDLITLRMEMTGVTPSPKYRLF